MDGLAENTILLVDDEEFIRVVTGSMIKKLGYETLAAENGREAIDLFSENYENIALVILDWKLPEMKAENIIKAIHKIRPGMKILISSGFFPERPELIKQKSFSFLQKPYDLDEFKRKVNLLINSSN